MITTIMILYRFNKSSEELNKNNLEINLGIISELNLIIYCMSITFIMISNIIYILYIHLCINQSVFVLIYIHT